MTYEPGEGGEWRKNVERLVENVVAEVSQSWRRVILSIRRNPQAWVGGVLTGLGVIAVGLDTRRNAMKKVFVSFAVEDAFYRKAIAGQALNTRTPFQFTDVGLDEPFSERWKTQCRAVIKSSDGVIALLSKNTRSAEGARWEMKCAVEEGIPILGVHIHKDDKGAVPTELDGQRVIEWNWDGIARFIDSL